MGEPLPPLVELSDFEGDWELYLENLYELFEANIVDQNLTIRGLPLKFKYSPPTDNKGFSFWHLISEGGDETNRTPDLRRCERILWVAWVIRNFGKDENIRWFENKRGVDQNLVLWYFPQKYVVVVSIRSSYYLLKTAYILSPRRELEFYKEWQRFGSKS